MKPLTALNNVEMAKLLFDLVPAEIPAFIEYITQLYSTFIEQKEKIKENWDHGFLTFQSWLNLAESTQTRINTYGDKLCKKANLFADQLFGGYSALWSRHCATQYANHESCPTDFKNAVTLLFDRDRTSLEGLRLRFEELNRDTDNSIKKTCAFLLKYSGKEIININTTNDCVYIGEYDQQLNGYACLTSLTVKHNGLYIESDFTGNFLEINNRTDLRINDKLAILNVLLSHRTV